MTLASGAADVLEQATLCASLQNPGRCQRGGGADQPPARNRHTTAHPRQACPSLLARAAAGEQVALVFGNETFGLSIEEVELCNVLVTIPGNPAYFSLNLAQAVQVLAYELFSHTGQDLDALRPEVESATQQQVEGFYQHLEHTLTHIGF